MQKKVSLFLSFLLLLCFTHSLFADPPEEVRSVPIYLSEPQPGGDVSDDLENAPPPPNTYELSPGLTFYPVERKRYGKMPKLIISTLYPELKTEEENTTVENFNQLVLALVEEEVIAFKNQVANTPSLPAASELYIDYNSIFIHPNDHLLLSIRFSIQGFIAGNAHRYHYYRVLNYDLSEEKNLALIDLFQPEGDYLAFIAKLATLKLHKKLGNNLLEQGILPTEENYKNWTLHADGLMITFKEGQVAPALYGTQNVTLSYKILAPFLNQASLIAPCTDHPKRCRAEFSTGGFLESAVQPQNRRFNPILYSA